MLTEDEEKIDNVTRELRFNIPMLAERLIQVTDWILLQPSLRNFKIGYFGSSTGAAAAHHDSAIDAIVSRRGRPDLANNALPFVRAPTLMIVGSLDNIVIDLNKVAINKMTSVKNVEMVLIPGSTHLFEEPGKLEEVVKLATEWLLHYLK